MRRLLGVSAVALMLAVLVSLLPASLIYAEEAGGLKARAQMMLDTVYRAIQVLGQNGVNTTAMEKMYGEAKQLYSRGEYNATIAECMEIMKAIRNATRTLMEQKTDTEELAREKLEMLARAVENSRLPDAVKQEILSYINKTMENRNITLKDVATLTRCIKHVMAQHYRSVERERVRRAVERMMEMEREVMVTVSREISNALGNSTLANTTVEINITVLVQALHMDNMTPRQIVGVLRALHLMVYHIYRHRGEIAEKMAEHCRERLSGILRDEHEVRSALKMLEKLARRVNDRQRAEKYVEIIREMEHVLAGIDKAVAMMVRGEDPSRIINATEHEISTIEKQLEELRAGAKTVEEQELITGMEKALTVIKDVLGRIAGTGYKAVVSGVLVWRHGNDTLVVIGINELVIPGNRTATIIPVPIIRIYIVNATGAKVYGNITLGQHIYVLGEIQETHGLIAYVKAEEITVKPPYTAG